MAVREIETHTVRGRFKHLVCTAIASVSMIAMFLLLERYFSGLETPFLLIIVTITLLLQPVTNRQS